MPGRMRILLVMASPPSGLAGALEARGHELIRAGASIEAWPRADLVVVDAEQADASDMFGALAPGTDVVVVGPGNGALHPDVIERLARPLDIDRLVAIADDLARVLDSERQREPVALVAYETLFAGDSPQVRDLVRKVRLVARNEEPVWLFGDDGSGRSVVARAIHDRSARRNEPFVALNAVAFSDEELCTQLFHGEQAATLVARRGTLFLDRFTTIGPQTQRELVRHLENRAPNEPSARFVVGVQRTVALAGAPSLATELYFRLKVLEVEIPLLAERARDLGAIVERMIARLAPDGAVLAPEAMKLLERYSFPGNLLELAHALTHAYVLAAGDAIAPQHLPLAIRRAGAANGSLVASAEELEALEVVAKRFERDYLLQVLRNTGGNRGRAAEILGLSRKGLWGKLKAHGISDDEIEPDEP